MDVDSEVGSEVRSEVGMGLIGDGFVKLREVEADRDMRIGDAVGRLELMRARLDQELEHLSKEVAVQTEYLAPVLRQPETSMKSGETSLATATAPEQGHSFVAAQIHAHCDRLMGLADAVAEIRLRLSRVNERIDL